jgi:hypothetical protein
MRPHARWLAWSGLCALLAPAAGCGDSLGPEQTITVASTPSLDGFVRSDGIAGTNGGGPAVGDLDNAAPDVRVREFWGFDLSGVPANSEITGATLKLYQLLVLGEPYATLGNAVVDHVDYGTTLEAGDYDRAALASGFAIAATGPDTASHEVDATSQVRADWAAGRTRTEFRLRFSIQDGDNDGINDIAAWTDAELSVNGSGVPPQLVITYRAPK